MSWDAVINVLSSMSFWIGTIVSWMLWYLVAIWMARSFLDAGSDPMRAAKAGPLWAACVSAVFVGIGSWFLWDDFLMSGLLATIAFLVPLTFVMLASNLGEG